MTSERDMEVREATLGSKLFLNLSRRAQIRGVYWMRLNTMLKSTALKLRFW